MKELTLTEIEQVSGAGSILMEIATTISGAALGCATAFTLFPVVSVSWFGIIPISLPFAGGIIGGAIGNIIYNVEQITEDYAAMTHAAAYAAVPATI